MPSVRENATCSAVSISLREKVRPARREVGVSETKFALLGLLSSKTRQNSPCTRKICEKAAFRASWANFVPNMRCPGSCWASFFTELLLDGPYWARFFAPTGTAPRSWRRRGALHVGTGGGLPPARPLCTVSPACRTLVLCNSPLRSAASVCVRAGFPRVLLVRRISVAMLTARGHNKTARRATGRGWSGRRESNPPLKLGKLPFYR